MTALSEHLLRYCRETFPARSQMQLADFSPISDGWETEVYTFTVTYKTDTGARRDDLILRVYPGGDAIEKSTREFNGMRQLHGMGYPVPEVLRHETDAAWLGKPFVIMEKIAAGRPMGTLWTSAPPTEQQNYLTHFCKLFVELHALDYRPFKPPEVSDLDLGDPLFFLRRWLREARHTVLETFQRQEFEPVLDWLDAHMRDVPAPRWSVIHGDFHPFNILMTPSGEPYVIDWSNIDVGDYRYDLAWTLLLTGTYRQPEMRDMILAEYEHQDGQPAAQIEYFDVMAAARRLFSIVLSMTAGAEQLGMRAEAAAIMRQQVDHIERVYAILRDRSGLSLPEITQWIETLK